MEAVIFLNTIPRVIGFFAMASPGCLSCADLFLPVWHQGEEPLLALAAAASFHRGQLALGVLGGNVAIQALTQSFGAGSSPRSS